MTCSCFSFVADNFILLHYRQITFQCPFWNIQHYRHLLDTAITNFSNQMIDFALSFSKFHVFVITANITATITAMTRLK